MGIIAWLILGLIAGALARWIMPGPDPMGWLGTILLGIVGSLVGGTLFNVIAGNGLEVGAAGLIGSVLGALIVLWAWRRWGPARSTA